MSTPTATPPSWLEAAAKLDALLGDKVPIRSEPEASATDDADGRPERDATATDDSAPSLTLPARTKPRSRITPPVAAAAVHDSAQEVDVAWHGVSPMAVLPSTLGLVALSALTILVVRSLVPARIVHEAVDGPLLALWLFQLIRGAYRLMAYNFRVTNRRLFRERGRLYSPEPPMDLATVTTVESRQTRLERWLGVGTVRVVPEDATPPVPAVEIVGVRRPATLAARIEKAVTAAREATVSTGKVLGEPPGSSRRSDSPPG